MKKSLVPAKPIEMPEEFQRFFDLPAMVGDEKHRDYYDFSSAIANAVKPTDIFEWIWVHDFVEAEWDIRRNRRIKVDTIKLKEQELITERKCQAQFNRIRVEMLRERMLSEADAGNPGEPERQNNKKDTKPEVAKPEVANTEVANIEDPYLLAKVFVQYGNEIDLIERRISAGEKKARRDFEGDLPAQGELGAKARESMLRHYRRRIYRGGGVIQMTSERKIAANRDNAKKSTGPRSEGGRSVSRHNALRHGLAVSIGNESFGGDVEDLAKVLSSASGLQSISGVAREAAEAQLDLSRIRKIRDCLYETIYFVDGVASDRLAELNDKLAKLERYERRAFSRRKHALRLM
jgi:hypothetical protein